MHELNIHVVDDNPLVRLNDIAYVNDQGLNNITLWIFLADEKKLHRFTVSWIYNVFFVSQQMQIKCTANIPDKIPACFCYLATIIIKFYQAILLQYFQNRIGKFFQQQQVFLIKCCMPFATDI